MNNSFIQIPHNLDDPVAREQFLIYLIEQINILLGNIPSKPVVTYNQYIEDKNNLNIDINNNKNNIIDIQEELPTFSKIDGSRDFTSEVKYKTNVIINDDNGLINKGYVDSNFTNNPQQANIAKLNQDLVTRSDTYKQLEAQAVANNVKAIADKIDEILDTLINSNIIT